MSLKKIGIQVNGKGVTLKLCKRQLKFVDNVVFPYEIYQYMKFQADISTTSAGLIRGKRAKIQKVQK
jgi:hypothetical protein